MLEDMSSVGLGCIQSGADSNPPETGSICNGGNRRSRQCGTAVTLDASWPRLQVRHYDIGGGILTRLEWKLPSMTTEETIRLNRFRTTADDTAT